MNTQATQPNRKPLAPTWGGIVHLLAEVSVTAESIEARRQARTELQRLARIADALAPALAEALQGFLDQYEGTDAEFPALTQGRAAMKLFNEIRKPKD
jgi:hypothetical protein